MSAIIMYENGKAIGGEGHTSDSSDITFDNTGTDLVSENVENAIKEVNDKTKHGIVELWKNSNISANFAGQTINILNYDNTKYDGIVIVPEVVSGESRLGTWYQIDKDVLSISSWSGMMEHLTIGASNSKVYRYARNISISLSGTTLSVTFSDCTNTEQNAIGTAPTVTTNNALMIPVRILGLIHNS